MRIDIESRKLNLLIIPNQDPLSSVILIGLDGFSKYANINPDIADMLPIVIFDIVITRAIISCRETKYHSDRKNTLHDVSVTYVIFANVTLREKFHVLENTFAEP